MFNEPVVRRFSNVPNGVALRSKREVSDSQYFGVKLKAGCSDTFVCYLI